jgi:thermosome
MAQAIPATIGGQQVLILKEGSERSIGRDAQRNNITAANVVAEIVKTSFGPRGLDKMLVSGFGDITITSDGATILKEMDIEHPAAKMMIEVAKATDEEVGDGTTAVVILTGSLLEKAQQLLSQNVHPTLIIDGYRKASEEGLKILEEISIEVSSLDKDILRKIASTSMATKLIQGSKEALASLAVDSVLKVVKKTKSGYEVEIDDITVEKKSGGSMADTMLIDGVAVNKDVVHDRMPKRIDDAKLLLINAPFQVEKTEFDGRIGIERPEEMKAWLDEETRLLKEMVDDIVSVGANVVICQKAIEEPAQQYMAQNGILAVRQLVEKNMERVAKATGGKILSSLKGLSQKDLGYAEIVEERKLAGEDWLFIEGCKNPKAITLLIRGGTAKATEEAERAIHDALCVVRDVIENPRILAGGGAPEAEVSSKLRDWAETLSGKEQLAAIDFADAIEEIPLILAHNAGVDPIDTGVELRSKHKTGDTWAGVDASSGKIKDMRNLDVYEPLAVKVQVLKSALEAASMILRIDDVIAAGKMKTPGPPM